MVGTIQGVHLPALEDTTINSKNIKKNNNVFDDFYKAAIDLVEDTNRLEVEADQKSVDFAMGKISNIEDVLIAQEKAYILLQYTIQVRNKVVESYKEIMRMPL